MFRARLHIPSVRAAGGPSVELLEYPAPRDGCPLPADERASDLMHRQTAITGRDPDGHVVQLRVAS